MILLAINGGLGPSDLARLPLPVVNKALKTGVLDYAAAKRRFKG